LFDRSGQIGIAADAKNEPRSKTEIPRAGSLSTAIGKPITRKSTHKMRNKENTISNPRLN
jgi:hypothetical protein